MSRAHYFYFKTSLVELEKKIESHQLNFEELLGDTFSEEQLVLFEKKLDELGALYVQPIFPELSFDDFYPRPGQEDEQRLFFSQCRSSLCLENLADFETNPFQVTYLNELLREFDEVLVDTGGVNEIEFKKTYLESLKKFKNIFTLLPESFEKKSVPLSLNSSDPIQALVTDLNKTLRLSGSTIPEDIPEKTKKLYLLMLSEEMDSTTLLRRSGMIPKDFGDHLERIKMLVKKCH